MLKARKPAYDRPAFSRNVPKKLLTDNAVCGIMFLSAGNGPYPKGDEKYEVQTIPRFWVR